MKKLFTTFTVFSAVLGSIVLVGCLLLFLLWPFISTTKEIEKSVSDLGVWQNILLDEWYLGSNATPASTKTITFNDDFTVDVDFDSYTWEIRTVSNEVLVINIYKDEKRFAYAQIEANKPYKLWYSICTTNYCDTNRYFYNDLSYDGS